MEKVLLSLIEFAKSKGLGDLCLLVACFALLLTLIHSAGFHPLDFSRGIIREVRASSDHASPTPTP